MLPIPTPDVFTCSSHLLASECLTGFPHWSLTPHRCTFKTFTYTSDLFRALFTSQASPGY